MTQEPDPTPRSHQWWPTRSAATRRGRARAVLAIAVTSALLTVGCGSDDGVGAPATSTTGGTTGSSADSTTSTTATGTGDSTHAGGEACDIVSDEVAAEVLGVDIVRREPHGATGDATVGCIKGSDRTDDLATSSYVSASVTAGGTALLDQASSEAGSQVVAGLGDRAVYLPDAGALFVADGTDLVQVQVVKAGVPGSQQDCVTVAQDVLDSRG